MGDEATPEKWGSPALPQQAPSQALPTILPFADDEEERQWNEIVASRTAEF